MDQRIDWLYEHAYGFTDQEFYGEELREQCSAQEEQMLEAMTPEQREIVECYLQVRDELDFQTVRLAFLRGKSLGEEIGKNKVKE